MNFTRKALTSDSEHSSLDRWCVVTRGEMAVLVYAGTSGDLAGYLIRERAVAWGADRAGA
jgi:hypothetical protein